MSTPKRRLNAADVKRAADGRWLEILPAVARIDADVLDKRHHPCPKCGGADRFRCLDTDKGALFCNQCFHEKNGDGFAAVAWLNECSFPEAVRTVAEFLNLPGSHNGHTNNVHATNGKPRSNGVAKPNGQRKRDTKPKGARFKMASDAVAALMKQHGRPIGQWTYHNTSGEPVALVLRFDTPPTDERPDGSKEFRPVSRHDDGGWYIKAPPTPRPLYGLPDVTNATTVYVCEGEKATDAARSLSLVAVTSMSGSKSPKLSDWTPLVGMFVVILPDNDTDGHNYAETVADILRRLDSSTRIKILDLPELPPKGDLVEWIAAHGDAAEPDAMRRELEALVNTADAIEPQHPEPPIDRFEPFPVDALPEPVRSFVIAGAKSIGCDESFVALPMLAMLGAAIGNTRRLFIKRGWTEPPIVWTVIVGNSGSSKSPALDLALQPIKIRQRDALRRYADAMEQYRADELVYGKALDTWKRAKDEGSPPTRPLEPVAERYLADDTTIESLAGLLRNQPRGLLVSRDELAGWLGGFDRYANGKGGDVAKWLEMFGGREIVIDRKTGEPRTLFISRAAVCLTGGIQPETLKRCLVQAHVDNGLAARLLFACPPPRPRRWTDAVVDERLEAEYFHAVDTLFHLQFAVSESGESEPKLVTLSPDALRRFQEFVNEHGTEHVHLADDLSAVWSKLEGYAARFALIVHLARAAVGEGDETAVDLRSLEAGIVLARWFGREARRISAMLGESNDDSERRKLVEWIERKGGSVTARELQQGNRRYKSSEAAELALDQLAKSGCGRWEPSPGGRRGQPTRRFTVTVSTASTSTVLLEIS